MHSVEGKVLGAKSKRTRAARTLKQSSHECKFLLEATFIGNGGYELEEE